MSTRSKVAVSGLLMCTAVGLGATALASGFFAARDFNKVAHSDVRETMKQATACAESRKVVDLGKDIGEGAAKTALMVSAGVGAVIAWKKSKPSAPQG